MKITKFKILTGLFIIIALWAGSAYCITNYLDGDRGTFGDMFGAINALFSGLALFGIIISILIQQKELNLQRQELAETRGEFKINRLTTIMFNQIGFFNSLIDQHRFGDMDIYKLIRNLKKHGVKTPSFLILINSNEKSVLQLTIQVQSILKGFEAVLNQTSIPNEEKVMMKEIFTTNINPVFFTIVVIFTQHYNREIKAGKEKGKTSKLLYERFKYIVNFKSDLAED